MSFAKCAIYLTNIYVVRKEESLTTWERGLKLCYLRDYHDYYRRRRVSRVFLLYHYRRI